MHATVLPTDRQLKATTGNHSQKPMPFMGLVDDLQVLPQSVLSRISFNGCLNESVRHCGMDDQLVAEALPVCKGYFSRFMRGVAEQWAKRLIRFMQVTRSLAPLQWMAEQLGCDVVPRDSRAAEVAALTARLRELEGVRA